MAITALGVDLLNSVQGRQHCQTDAWMVHSYAVDKGTLAIIINNQVGRFPEDVFVRLRFPSPYTKALTGTVTQLGIPCARKLRCYRRSDGHMVAETISDAVTGAYSFTGLATDEMYYIVAFDDMSENPDFNALVLDQLVGI